MTAHFSVMEHPCSVHLAATSTAWPSRVYWSERGISREHKGQEVEGTQPGHGTVTQAPGPGWARCLALLRHLLPFPIHPPQMGPTGGAGGHRKASAGSQWAPSPATEVLELSRCSEADQRISDKLERRFRKRAAVGNQPLCWFLWL